MKSQAFVICEEKKNNKKTLLISSDDLAYTVLKFKMYIRQNM